MATSRTLRKRFVRLSARMNEKLRQHWAGCEALAIGRGGISAVLRAMGISRPTIRRGVQEVRQQMPSLAAEVERVRRPAASHAGGPDAGEGSAGHGGVHPAGPRS